MTELRAGNDSLEKYSGAMKWILFFDGDCAFCSKSVQLIIRLDRREQVSFAPLQGELSQKMGFSKYAAKEGGTMVLLRESDGKIFTHSDGLIELAHVFGGAWRILSFAGYIPKPIRDFVYRRIANNRHRLMGKSTSCALPAPALLKRLRD